MYIYPALINALSAHMIHIKAKFAIISRADATTPVKAHEHYSEGTKQKELQKSPLLLLNLF